MLEPRLATHHMLSADVDARRSDLQQEAARDRLIREARSARPGLSGRVLVEIGGLLISAGSKLQKQHGPVLSHKPEAYQSN